MQEESLAVAEAARNHLVEFEIATNPKYIPNWHHEIIGAELENLEKVGDRDYKILIVTVPPRHGKSQQCSIDFPAWFLGKNPDKEIIVASYSGELAQDFGGKTREKVNSQEYQSIFNARLREDERSKGKWRTLEGGSYTSVGVGGALTGRGADILLIDDPIKNREEAESDVYRDKTFDWFSSTAFTRLEPKGVVILILTRWHMDDLAGRILLNSELATRTKLIRFPAIAENDEKFRKKGEALWSERYGIATLHEIQKTIGPYDFSALYQGSPVLSEDQEFRPAWIQRIQESEVAKMSCRRFLTIDTAISKKASADFTGFVDNSVNRENFWHLRAWHAKLNPQELIQTIFDLHEANRYEKIGIEKTTFTEGLKPFFEMEQRKRNKFLPLVELSHRQTGKEIRIRGLIPRYSTGSIFHIQGQCSDLEHELATFPVGVNDDVCLTSHTLVATINGWKQIMNVKVGERVWTRKGLKTVLWSGKTGRKKVITRIGLTGTPNHRIWTANRGWIQMQFLKQSDMVVCADKLSNGMATAIIDTLPRNADNYKSTFMPTGLMVHLMPSIETFGNFLMGRFRQVFIFIIKMGRMIIACPPLRLQPRLNTEENTGNQKLNLPEEDGGKGSPRRYCQKLLSQDEQPELPKEKEKKTRLGKSILRKLTTFFPVRIVALRYAMPHGGNIVPACLAVKRNETLPDMLKDKLFQKETVDFVENNIEMSVKMYDSALRRAGILIPCVASGSVVDVYNLEVEDCHEYFANNILVKNCDALAYQLQLADSSQRTGVSIHVPTFTAFNRW